MLGGGYLSSLRITVSPWALAETTERLFPPSRHRSARIHKKLVRRFGGEFARKPAIFQTPDGIVCHPSLYAQLKESLA